MNLTICLALAVFNFIFMWLYLATNGFHAAKELKHFSKLVRDHVKLNIYCVAMLAVSIGLAFLLEIVYKENLLIVNIKTYILLGILAIACVTDIRERIIPNGLILYGLVVRIIIAFAELFRSAESYFAILKNDLIAVAFAAILFLVCGLIVKNGIGMGDIKLVFIMGIFQGFTGMISSVFMSLVVAFFWAIYLLSFKKKSRKDSMEFAPSLLMGMIVSLILTGC